MAKVANLTDFSEGYATDLPPEKMSNKMLLVAENCWWVEKLKSRGGKNEYTTFTDTNVGGIERVYINNAWNTILAVNTNAITHFYYGSSNAYTEIDASYIWTSAADVDMVVHRDKVIAVNGANLPAIVYYDSGWYIEDLEQYDVRTRGNDDWNAGQYDTSASAYTDDTTDAQDIGRSNDFGLALNNSAGDGLWISCFNTFTKVVVKDAEQFSGSPVAAYEYYKEGGTWSVVTMETTPTWTDATGDKTLEFAWPSDWIRWDGTEAHMKNMFVFRIRFTTAPSNSPSADYLQIKNTHYLTQITGDSKPQAVAVHNKSTWLAVGNNVYFSDANSVKGWELYQADYCLEGGNKILKMISHGEYLAILKEAALYGFLGNQFRENAIVRKLTDVGTISSRSAAIVGDYLLFLSRDGIRLWDGKTAIKVSKHIQTDIDGWTLTDAAAVRYKGWYILSFPTDQIILVADPDTFRMDEMGDGRLSWYKWTNCLAKDFMWWNGNGESGELMAIGTHALLQYDDGNEHDSNAAIDMIMKTRRLSWGEFQQYKISRRIKVDISQAGPWTITLEADHGIQSIDDSIASGDQNGHYSKDISLPYTMDGKDLAIQLRNNTANEAIVYGMALDVAIRRF